MKISCVGQVIMRNRTASENLTTFVHFAGGDLFLLTATIFVRTNTKFPVYLGQNRIVNINRLEQNSFRLFSLFLLPLT